MRTMLILLLASLLALQYKLWFGDGNFLEWKKLEKNLAIQKENNQLLMLRNKGLEMEIVELKKGAQALEEQARLELGMVKKGETYYQFVD